MAKGQKRSGREVKKPKANKAVIASPTSFIPARPEKAQPAKSPGK